MKNYFFLTYFLILFSSCKTNQTKNPTVNRLKLDSVALKETYGERQAKNLAHKTYFLASWMNKKELTKATTSYWVKSIADTMYQHWAGTTWDFNGTTQIPKQGAIACGYFVTTVLQDMGVKLNRVKLAICASSEMMKALTPGQKFINLSTNSLEEMRKQLLAKGEAVYIIGLDYHTGFIVVDNSEVWFVHSYFVNRQGVIKEKITSSASLGSSKIKWLVSLTSDVGFMKRWLSD